MLHPRAFLLFVLVATAACSLPAPSFEAYRSKALDAAEETISQSETAILTVELAERDRLVGAIPTVQLENAERASAAAASDFASVLPPDDRSDRLRGTVLPDLKQASDLIARIRFALRRGDLEEAIAFRSSLEEPLADLEQFVEPEA